MAIEKRQPEGRDVDEAAIDVFSKIARLGSRMAAVRIDRIIGREIKRGMHVLDIGTGPGTIPLEMGRRLPGIRAVGLDVSTSMLAKAAKNSRCRFPRLDLVAGDGEELPFHDNTFDVVTSFFAVHHMERPDKLLVEVDRVLKTDGVLLMIDFRRDMAAPLFKLMNCFWQLLFCFSAGRTGLQASVRSAYTRKELGRMLRQRKIERFCIYTNPIELIIMRQG